MHGGSSVWLRVVALSLILLPACSEVPEPTRPDVARPGVGVPDAGSPPLDAPQAMSLTPAREVVSGGGRVQGETITMDVQIGHPADQRPASAGATRVEPNAAVKP